MQSIMPDYPSWQYHHNFEEISDLAFRVGSANHPIQALVDVLAPTSNLLVTGEADTPFLFFSLFFIKPSCVLLTCRSQWCWHMKTLWNRANQWKVDSNFSPIKQAAIPVEHSSTSMQRPFLGKQRFIFWNKEMVIEITMIIVMLVKNIIIIALLSTLNQASTQSHR